MNVATNIIQCTVFYFAAVIDNPRLSIFFVLKVTSLFPQTEDTPLLRVSVSLYHNAMPDSPLCINNHNSATNDLRFKLFQCMNWASLVLMQHVCMTELSSFFSLSSVVNRAAWLQVCIQSKCMDPHDLLCLSISGVFLMQLVMLLNALCKGS